MLCETTSRVGAAWQIRPLRCRWLGRAYYLKWKMHIGLTHESRGEVGVCADLAVDLDQTLHHDLGHLGVGQGVLQPVTQEDDQRQRLTQLVWALGRTGSEHSSQLVQHPCLRGIETLQMLLGAASLQKTKAKLRLGALADTISFPGHRHPPASRGH